MATPYPDPRPVFDNYRFSCDCGNCWGVRYDPPEPPPNVLSRCPECGAHQVMPWDQPTFREWLGSWWRRARQ